MTNPAPVKRCPFCAEEILVEARKCKHCGEILDHALARQRANQPVAHWNAGTAAVLSLVIPGAGQMYRGDVGEGIAWLAFAVLGYLFFIVPGLAIHVACIINARKDPSEVHPPVQFAQPRTPAKPSRFSWGQQMAMFLGLVCVVLIVMAFFMPR